jgi:hypothetical protein
VLWGIDSGGVFEFELFLLILFWFQAFYNSYLPFWLGLPIFVPFDGIAAFFFF